MESVELAREREVVRPLVSLSDPGDALTRAGEIDELANRASSTAAATSCAHETCRKPPRVQRLAHMGQPF